MSATTHAEFLAECQRVRNAVACPHCHAEAGQPCVLRDVVSGERELVDIVHYARHMEATP